MKNINQLINKDKKDLNYKLKLAFDEAKKNDDVKEVINMVNMPEEELIKHTSFFEEAAKEYKNCKRCPGLAACKNSINGFCYLPVVNNDKLSFSYVSCKYKNAYLKENKYLSNVLSINVPKEIREAKIKCIYTDDKNRAETIKWILNYIKEYRNGSVNKGLFLHGNFGCGKTYLLAAMFNELAKEGVKCVIVYWPEYLRELKSSFQSNNSNEFKEKFNDVKYAKLLLIDDLGAEGVTTWSRDEILGTILQYRMQENLPTFITSNFNLKELEEHLSITASNRSEKVKAVRIIERIKQLTTDMTMVSKNNRN